MSLTKILEYQEIDLEIYREEQKLMRSEKVKRLSFVQQQIAKVEQGLLRMDKEAEGMFAEAERLEAKIADLVAKDKAHFSFASVVSLEQLENIENALNEYSEEISALEREVRKLFSRLKEIKSEGEKQYDTGKSLQRERGNLRAFYGKQNEELKEKFKPQLEKMQKLRAEIEPSLYSAYKNLRDNRKMPAFTNYDNGSCTACGMDVRADVDKKIKNPGDTAECPNCRRILYK